MLNKMWHCVCLLVLALLHGTGDAYMMVSMNDICGSSRLSPIRLSKAGHFTAVSFSINGSAETLSGPCFTTIIAYPGFEMSLLVSRTTTAQPAGAVHCPLRLFSADYEYALEADLCSQQGTYTEQISSNKVFLVWSPPPPSLSHHIQAVQVVVTAIGTGIGMCSSRAFFPCQKRLRHAISCVARELVCDGLQNCPPGGGDEHPAICGIESRPSSGSSSTLTTLHKILSVVRQASQKVQQDFQVTTVKPTNSANDGDVPDSIPEILAYYSPWGYLMLGMLITGSVLMLCGLWECCCRRHQPTAVGPATMFIMNSHVEAPPPTPEPPAYEDLDQPPAYDSLFAITKPLSVAEEVVT